MSSLNIKIPQVKAMEPRITVFGVGGAGGNAVNNMSKKLEGASFVVANTDAQALDCAIVDKKIQLGPNTTEGLGAGADPQVGKIAADEVIDEIRNHLEGSNMVFITAGMGGGTGTGASSVIAKTAREMGILTVGVVTKPFHFEGARRMRVAEHGIEELQKNVDTLIVIPNQNLFRIANEKTTFAEAFTLADDVLYAGVRGVTDLMIMPGLINLDFADIRAVMSEMGKAMMGTGEAEGENRAKLAADAAISNPLLDNVSMKGAKGVLINITGGLDMTLFEVDEAANRVREEVDPSANVIFGSTFNEDLNGKMRVSVVATGIDMGENVAKDMNSTARFSGNNPFKKNSLANNESLKNILTPNIENIEKAEQDKKKAETVSTNMSNIKLKPKEEHKSEAVDKDEVETLQLENEYMDVVNNLNEEFEKLKFDNNKNHFNIEDNIFKAPPAITPNSYNIESSPTGNLNNRERFENFADEDEVQEKSKYFARSDLGLFSRMARGVARSFHSSEAEEKEEQEEKQHAFVSSSDSKKQDLSQEELLDIPAFLRRNNNKDAN